VESEGSRRQSAGLTNRKRVEAAVRDEKAYIFKVQYLYGTHGSIHDRHKREGICALPGEVCKDADVSRSRLRILRPYPRAERKVNVVALNFSAKEMPNVEG
jgi:hypothetical protein